MVICIQQEFHDIIEKFQAKNRNNNLILEKKIEKLSNQCNHFEERLHQYENDQTKKSENVKIT